MPPNWRVVLQIDSPQRTECLRFADIPVVDPAHIAIVAEDPVSSAEADRLFRRLKATLSTLSPQGLLPDQCGGPRLLGCMARNEPTCHSLLVVVTGKGKVSHRIKQLMHDWQGQRRQRSKVQPILPAGANPGTILPAPLDLLIALFRTVPVEMLAPDVLRAARIGGADHRLFVSYRRDDAQDLAEQLHDAFTHVGFKVFLDRFRGTPGRPFPRVLAEELADQGMLLVLESQYVRNSPWTLAEVAFARALRLGLLALAMPSGPPFQVISNRDRHQPATSDWLFSGKGPILTDSACDEVVNFVRQQYAEQSLYRQLYLENLLHLSLAPHLKATAAGGGAFHVKSKKSYLLQLSSRPPRLSEVRRASSGARPHSAHPVIVGTHRYLPPEDGSDLQWVANELHTSLRSEGYLPRMAAALAAGKVPP